MTIRPHFEFRDFYDLTLFQIWNNEIRPNDPWNIIICSDNMHMKYIERDDKIHTHTKKIYTVCIQGHICLRHLYNIGLDGGISINRRGLLACWNDFFLPGLPEIHEQGGVHLVTDDMLQKLGIVIITMPNFWSDAQFLERGQDIRAELVFVSLWDWVQKI